MKLKKLTNKELDVLRVLWDAEDPLLASEIYKIDPSLNSNTVQAALRNLTKKGYIKVADIVYSGTVLSRRYTPIVTQPEYVKMFFPATPEEKLTFMEGFIKDIEDLDELNSVQKLLDRKKADPRSRRNNYDYYFLYEYKSGCALVFCRCCIRFLSYPSQT